MGNESSVEVAKFTREDIKLYQEKNKEMENTIKTNTKTIRIYQEENKKMEDTIMTNKKMIQMIMAENYRLIGTIEDLKTDIKKKDEDTKCRINDVCNSRKKLELELNKYKSIPEFDAILNLNKDLVDFETKIKESIESNCDMLQTNKHDEEIEQIKKRNFELYGKLPNSSMRALVAKKSAEVKEAENELIAKKEAARKKFVKINAQLAQIKDKMGEATAKFAGTVENSISELRKTLHAYQREVIAIGNDVKTDDSLIHEKVKNILLQQENTMMKEMMTSNVGPSTNFGELSPKRQFVKCTIKKEQLPHLDNFDNFSIVDDVSETCSLSGSTKPYKLILLNVHESEITEKSDKCNVCIVLAHLTDLSLDDIDVQRIGKSAVRPRPIVVSFDDIIYVRELLKNRFLLRNTIFSMIRICPYKSKPNAPNPRAPIS